MPVVDMVTGIALFGDRNMIEPTTTVKQYLCLMLSRYEKADEFSKSSMR